MDELHKQFRKLETLIRQTLTQACIDGEELNGLALAMCNLCLATFKYNFILATRWGIETKTWAVITSINSWYRQQYKKLDNSSMPRPVERRRLTKTYITFLKGIQAHYVTTIQYLCEHQGLPHHVRERLIIEPYFQSPRCSNGRLQPQPAERLTRSCYASLIHLGDLCRYREQIRHAGVSKLEVAIYWYTIAAGILPGWGQAYHQLAIVHMTGQNSDSRLRAMYYLYRAAATDEPVRTAMNSLQSFFQKAIQDTRNQTPSRVSTDSKSNEIILEHARQWAVRFPEPITSHKAALVRVHDLLQSIMEFCTDGIDPLASTGKRTIRETLKDDNDFGLSRVRIEHEKKEPDPRPEKGQLELKIQDSEL